jgi:hypothetical protein
VFVFSEEANINKRLLTIASLPHGQTHKPNQPDENNGILSACLGPTGNRR